MTTALTRTQVAGVLKTDGNLDAAARRIFQVADQPVRAAFLARALNALAELAPKLDERSLGDATGAGLPSLSADARLCSGDYGIAQR